MKVRLTTPFESVFRGGGLANALVAYTLDRGAQLLRVIRPALRQLPSAHGLGVGRTSDGHVATLPATHKEQRATFDNWDVITVTREINGHRTPPRMKPWQRESLAVISQ